MFFAGNSNLPFLALLVGSLISYTGYCLWNRSVSLLSSPGKNCKKLKLGRFYFEQKFVDTGGKIKPEARLPMAMAATVMFPVSRCHRPIILCFFPLS